MSFASDHVAAVDAQLDQLAISGLAVNEALDQNALQRVRDLQSLVKSLSSSNKPLSRLSDILGTLRSANLSDDSPSPYEHQLQWLFVGKITNHAYGLLLDTLIRQTLPLTNEIWYWNQVINSPHYLSLYTLQISPFRFWDWSKGVLQEARTRDDNISSSWRQFYGLVKGVVHDRSLTDVQRQLASPLIISRGEIRHKLVLLNREKLLDAAGIGYLLSNGFNDENLQLRHQAPIRAGYGTTEQQYKWRDTITKSISVMDAVLSITSNDELHTDDFDAAIQLCISEDPWEDYHRSSAESRSSLDPSSQSLKPSEATARLEEILRQLPLRISKSQQNIILNGRPSRLVRYWLPATILLFSSSTVLRLLINRKAELSQWLRDTGETMIDFWRNWIVEPTRKVIGTIRHNEESEVSIMSKRSLEGDRESLERMVVDFAIDNPEGPALSDAEVNEIKSKVQEGDVTPVLRAYERELKSPLYGSLRGNLVRTLLIQVQKTKVDVEVAMRGIDNLLKSQELVFGFVGLTPGVLVCLGVFNWIRNLPSSRRHSRQLRKQSQAVLIIRNIDRILTGSPQTDAGMLSFKEYGLLVCEAVVLRDVAGRTFPSHIFQEFLQDFDDLIDSQSGVGRQIRVADRMRWAYAKWL